jgi:hypothetical protein
MRLILVLPLCLISAATGAGINHYWTDAVLLLQPKQAQSAEPTRSAQPQEKKVEVLGDRVRCDVRFTELGLPVEEYRSFFDRCVGKAAPSD